MNSENNTKTSTASPFLTFLAGKAGKVLMIIVFAAIIWGIMLAAINTTNEYICLILALGLGYFGWRALNRITPQTFMWMHGASWIMYFVIKGVISVLIGYFVAPFWIAKRISERVMKYISSKRRI